MCNPGTEGKAVQLLQFKGDGDTDNDSAAKEGGHGLKILVQPKTHKSGMRSISLDLRGPRSLRSPSDSPLLSESRHALLSDAAMPAERTTVQVPPLPLIAFAAP